MNRNKMFKELSKIPGFKGNIIQYTVCVEFSCLKLVQTGVKGTLNYCCDKCSITENMDTEGMVFDYENTTTDEFLIDIKVYSSDSSTSYALNKARELAEEFKKQIKFKYKDVKYKITLADYNILTLEDLEDIDVKEFKVMLQNIMEEIKLSN